MKGNISNIKSNLILKKIFAHLCENLKLDLINFNIKIQKELLINIDDYKMKSYKYKEANRNGLGKEYIINSNVLIFEGEYIK